MMINSVTDPTVAALDVVIVEDNRAAQSLIRPMLTAMRVRRVRSYDRPEIALKSMISEPPSVVLSDWDVKPAMAERFLRLLRQRSFDPICFVPVLAVTSVPTMRFVDRAMSAGANNILVKPLSPAALQHRLVSAVRDERGYELNGDQFVVSGMQQLLDERVRNDNVADMIRRAEAVEAVWSGKKSRSQSAVDKILSDKSVGEGAQNGEAGEVERWHGWRI